MGKSLTLPIRDKREYLILVSLHKGRVEWEDLPLEEKAIVYSSYFAEEVATEGQLESLERRLDLEDPTSMEVIRAAEDEVRMQYGRGLRPRRGGIPT